MKTSDIQKADPTKEHVFYALIVVVLCFYSPLCIRVMRDAGGAVLFTGFLWLFPDSLRSRSGSLIPAFCLAVFLWFCAVVVGVMSFLGAVDL